MTANRSFFRRACSGVLLLAFFLGLYLLVGEIVAPVVVAGSGSDATTGRIADIVYHLELAKAHAAGGIDSPYDPASQWRVMSDFYGDSDELRIYAMPVGVTPLAFVVWRGLLAVTEGSVPAAVSLWVTASLAVFLIVIGLLYARIRSRARYDGIAFLSGAVLMAASLPAVLSVFLGQTSLLGASGLLLLCHAFVLSPRGEENHSVSSALGTIGFLLLVWKPPYLALGVGMLLFAGRRRAAVVGGVGTLLVIVAATLVASPQLLTEYVSQLVGFTGPQDFEFYRPWGVAAVGGSAATLRTLLLPFLGREAAYLVGAAVLLIATMAVLALGGWQAIAASGTRSPGDPGPTRGALRGPELVIALFALYLLLAPYVGRYEDLLILVPWAVVGGCSGRVPYESLRWPVAVSAIGLATVAFVPVPDTGGAIVPFLGKVVALGGMLAVTRKSVARTGIEAGE